MRPLCQGAASIFDSLLTLVLTQRGELAILPGVLRRDPDTFSRKQDLILIGKSGPDRLATEAVENPRAAVPAMFGSQFGVIEVRPNRFSQTVRVTRVTQNPGNTVQYGIDASCHPGLPPPDAP